MSKRRLIENGDPLPHALKAHQIAATASPGTSIREIVNSEPSEARAAGESRASGGNFKDLEGLLDHFATSPVFELGKPLPAERYLPRRQRHTVGRCPAAHNRALIGDAPD